MKEETYYRVIGEHGIYLFTLEELGNGLERENTGTTGNILPEQEYTLFNDTSKCNNCGGGNMPQEKCIC